MRILIRVTLIDVDAEAGRKTDRKAQIEESDEMRHYIKQDRQGDRTLCSNALSDQSILLKDSSCHKESYSLSTLFLLKKKNFYSLLFIWLSHCSTSPPTQQIRCQICYLFMENRSLATNHKTHLFFCKET